MNSNVDDVSWLISSFVEQTPGVMESIVVSSDGLLMAMSNGLDRAGGDRFAAVASGLIGLAYGAAGRFGGGRVNEVIVEGRSLSQNYPNPFNPVTRIAYNIRQAGPVSITVHNAAGRVIRTLLDRREHDHPDSGLSRHDDFGIQDKCGSRVHDRTGNQFCTDSRFSVAARFAADWR